MKYVKLLHRQKCFTGKYTTCEIHRKLHLGSEWCIFYVLSSGDIDDVISPFLWLFVQTVGENWRTIDLSI